MAGNPAEAGRTVTSKIVAILAVFTTGGPHTLSGIAGQADLAVSTTFRLLTGMVRSGLLDRMDDGGYRPAAGLCSLALHGDTEAPALSARGPLVVDDLSAALDLPVRLGVLDQLEVAYIEKRPGPFPGTLFPNRARLPVHATALGKALLAHAPRSLVQLFLADDLCHYTPSTITCSDQLQRALHHVRAHGFALEDRELDQTTCAVAVPVLDTAGRTVAAVEVQVPRLARSTIGDIVPALMLAARGLSRELERGDIESRTGRRTIDHCTAL